MTNCVRLLELGGGSQVVIEIKEELERVVSQIMKQLERSKQMMSTEAFWRLNAMPGRYHIIKIPVM